MSYEILRLTDRPELKETAARWFHEKWGIPGLSGQHGGMSVRNGARSAVVRRCGLRDHHRRAGGHRK